MDFVSGASIGAIVATFVALGMRAKVEQVLRTTFAPEVVSEVFQISLAGTSTGLDHLTRLFQETTGRRSFDETVILLAMMSVDLNDRGPGADPRGRCGGPARGDRAGGDVPTAGTGWAAARTAASRWSRFRPRRCSRGRADVTISVNLMSR